MNEQGSLSDSEMVLDIVVEWETRQARGESVAIEELCRDHPDLVADVRSAIADLQGLGPALEIRAEEDGPHPLEGQAIRTESRYRIGALVDRGGQGEVFAAVDETLGREVALKRMRASGPLSGSLASRFGREVAITGRLEHPGIVPIYGLGHDDREVPCYAMRLVRGETLDTAIDRLHQEAKAGPLDQPGGSGPALRSLLGRFVALCNVVAYAHVQGVVHRDIKPNNVMLGPFGETLLLDWGLAKTTEEPAEWAPESDDGPDDGMGFDPGRTPTVAGRAMGTPAFMSPEQAAGQWDRVGPASDVWALGATLFNILARRPPPQGDAIAGPRSMRPDVPPPLDAICRVAMANRPEDRYGSVLELAEDVERWLADEPVRAWPDPWSVTLGRWVRRNRTTVASAIVALATATIGLAMLALAVGREQVRTTIALEDARANFAMAREAVEEFGRRVADERLLNEPGMEDLRRALLASALEFHERFVQRAAADPNLLAELGRAQGRIAAIRAQTESPAVAPAAYREAIATLDRAAERRPDDSQLRLDQAALLLELAGAYQRTSAFDQGLAACLAAMDQYETLERRDPAPSASTLRRGRARSLHTQGTLQLARGDRDEAEKTLGLALDLEGPLAETPKPLPEDLNALGLTLNNLAVLCRLSGRLDESQAHYRRAVEVKRRLVDEAPKVAEYRASLAATQINHGKLLEQRHEPAAARAALDDAKALLLDLSRDYPRSTEHRFNLGQACLQRGLLDVRAGDLDAAEAAWREALTAFVPVVQAAPGVYRYVDDLVNALSNLANLAADRNDLEGALGWTNEALARLAPLEDQAAGNPKLVATRTELQALRADLLKRLGR